MDKRRYLPSSAFLDDDFLTMAFRTGPGRVTSRQCDLGHLEKTELNSLYFLSGELR